MEFIFNPCCQKCPGSKMNGLPELSAHLTAANDSVATLDCIVLRCLSENFSDDTGGYRVFDPAARAEHPEALALGVNVCTRVWGSRSADEGIHLSCRLMPVDQTVPWVTFPQVGS